MLWTPCWRLLAILEEVSDSAMLVVRGVLRFHVEVGSSWNLEQYGEWQDKYAR